MKKIIYFIFSPFLKLFFWLHMKKYQKMMAYYQERATEIEEND